MGLGTTEILLICLLLVILGSRESCTKTLNDMAQKFWRM